MFMDTTETGRLCNDVEHAAVRIRSSIGESTDISEVLDHLWFLQDSLGRLIEVVYREQGNVAQCRSIIRKVVNTLEWPQVRKQCSIPGVKLACEAINSSLIELEQITHRSETAGAN